MKEDYEFYESVEVVKNLATFTMYFVHYSKGVRGLLQFTTEHYSFNENTGGYHTGRDEEAEFFIVVDNKQKIKVPLGKLEVDRRGSLNDKIGEWRISKQDLPTDGMIFELMFSDYDVKVDGISLNSLTVCDYVASWDGKNVSPYSYSLFVIHNNPQNNTMIYITFSGSEDQGPNSSFTKNDAYMKVKVDGIIQKQQMISVERCKSGTHHIWKCSAEQAQEIAKILIG